ncbi:uncharacterized protein LOC136079729 [Hydra vulgaris]|uniref:Uncharacterized protein LOC136079729 n=1 Tax=Hydra vulgaris TaxID=6087 RepID=A0ABM4BSD2_HYDVU
MLTILIEEFFPDKYQSYIEKNFKMDSRYRRYAKIIPSFLINRPPEMVRHCLKKISLAESFDLDTISMINHGIFSIKGVTVNYQLDFGNDSNMPNCTCSSWRLSCYPCKHFFAIFKKFPLWQCDALPLIYRNSPFLTLDNEEIQFQNEEATSTKDKCDTNFPDSKKLVESEEINKENICNNDLNKESISDFCWEL